MLVSLFIMGVRTDSGYGALDEEDDCFLVTCEDSERGAKCAQKVSETDARQSTRRDMQISCETSDASTRRSRV
jgi:hypothetical protein